MIKARFNEPQEPVTIVNENGSAKRVFICLNGVEKTAPVIEGEEAREDKYIEYDYNEFVVAAAILPLLGVNENPEKYINGFDMDYCKTAEELQAAYTAYVQDKMDKAAQAYPYRYDNIASAASYKGSTDEKFNKEGTAFSDWRDKVWRKCFDILEDVLAGKRFLPTFTELDAELPQLEL